MQCISFGIVFSIVVQGILILLSLLCILVVQFSLTHKLSEKKQKALMPSQAVLCVFDVWRGWTCGKHNQPDDKMSNHPTGFLDLLVWEIEDEEMTAWLGTSSIFFSCCFLSWVYSNIISPFSLPAFQTLSISPLISTMLLHLSDFTNNIYLCSAA